MAAPRGGIIIDWQRTMSPDSPPAELEVVGSSPPASTHPSAAHADAHDGSEGGGDGSAAEFASLPDHKLRETINRWYGKTHCLSDGGEKMRRRVDGMKKELERRRADNQRKDEILHKQPLQAKTTSGSVNDPFAFNPDDMLSYNTPGKYIKSSSLISHTRTNIQDRGEASPLGQGKHAYMKKNSRMAISSAGHQLKIRAHHQKSTHTEHINKYSDSTKKSTLGTCMRNPQKNSTVNVKGKHNNFLEDDTTSGSERRWNLSRNKASPSFMSRKDVVLLDDDLDTEPARLVDVGISNRWDESKIYYPSSDPEAVDLTYSDLKCLEPEEYLKSPIINFFLLYLKKSRPHRDLHMFNTYFYSKLEEALSTMGDRDLQFSKLRKWWRNVDIFKKAYIILPINETMHWSLIIVCMPAKGTEAGPIMLHLDSLGLHSSQKLFNNVASYLEAEWRHLQKDSSYDIPFSGVIWKRLSRNIISKEVEVPRQRNDYDCGLFMLYYVDKFIQEAPERLTLEGLGMFGRKWFNHVEASGLRMGIRALLFDLFETEQGDDEPAGPAS
ncbi:hypothetical protein BS78_03G269500 [Paspalum vaginatum]|nr:hypothetical protein BS78_03G269500 [Paspalum vaginatum]